MKKKWTAIVLAIGMVFSITACGGKGGSGTGEAPKLDYANMTEEEWMKKITKEDLENNRKMIQELKKNQIIK